MAAQDDKAPGVTEGDSWITLTTHDTNPIAFRPVAIHNGTATAGTVVAKDADGNQSTFYLVAGQTLRIRPSIITTASTVTNIVGFKR